MEVHYLLGLCGKTMTVFETLAEDGDRTERSLRQNMEVKLLWTTDDKADCLVINHDSASDENYIVSLHRGANNEVVMDKCSCPDYKYRCADNNNNCKHERRLALELDKNNN